MIDVLIVIPYRDREDDLKYQFKSMESWLKTQNFKYQIIVPELESRSDWNLGILLNSIKDYIDKYQPKYIWNHHVDIFPLEGILNLPTIGECYSEIGDYGSMVINTDDFIKVDGYSNRFWGWGGEDNEFYMRCQENGIRVLPNMVNIKFDLSSQSHSRDFVAKNYSNGIKQLCFIEKENRIGYKDFSTISTVEFSEYKLFNNISYIHYYVYPIEKSPRQSINNNLIIGYIENKKWEDIVAWVKTAHIWSSYSYDIAIIIGDINPDEYLMHELKAFDIIVKHMPHNNNDNMFIYRFYCYLEFLKDYNYYNVLHTDVTDVVFNNDPWKDFVENKINITSEGIKVIDEEWNLNMYRNVYGYDIIDSDVYCGGIIAAPRDKFISLMRNIIDEYNTFSDIIRSFGGIDQILLIKIVNQNISDYYIHKIGDRWAINLHVIYFGKVKSDKIKLKDEQWYNDKDEKISIIHQINRYHEIHNSWKEFYKKSFFIK